MSSPEVKIAAETGEDPAARRDYFDALIAIAARQAAMAGYFDGLTAQDQIPHSD